VNELPTCGCACHGPSGFGHSRSCCRDLAAAFKRESEPRSSEAENWPQHTAWLEPRPEPTEHECEHETVGYGQTCLKCHQRLKWTRA